MKAELLAIGNEVTSGQISDTNSAWLASQLREAGIRVERIVVVGDRLEAIVNALYEASSRAPLVIVTGGLGPTFDDLTRRAAAQFAGVKLVRNQAAVSHLEAWFKNRERPMPKENLCQADLPAGAEMLENTQGTAPGFALSTQGASHRGTSPEGISPQKSSLSAKLFFLPGVPQEMQAMYRNAVFPLLQRVLPGGPPRTPFKIHLFGIWESEANRRLEGEFTAAEKRHLGIRASGGTISITVYGDPDLDGEEVSRATAHFPDRLRALFLDVAFGEGDTTLASSLVEAFRARGATVAVAESCTGGLIASKITSIAGASRVFHRGWVVYSNAAKMALLGVPSDLLKSMGAVSEPVARALAEGALQRGGSDVAVSVTGIAGPEGGTPEKPVGLVWFGAARRAGSMEMETATFCRRFNGPRSRIQLFSANTALDLARKTLARKPVE